jgi:hypothetical protein
VLHEKYTKTANQLVNYYVSYYSSALFGLMQSWFEGGMIEDSPTIAHIMLSVMFLKPGDPIRLVGRQNRKRKQS